MSMNNGKNFWLLNIDQFHVRTLSSLTMSMNNGKCSFLRFGLLDFEKTSCTLLEEEENEM